MTSLLSRLLGVGRTAPQPKLAEEVKRNLTGKALEHQGLAQQAVALYEQNVTDGFVGSHPYERLRIIYTRQKRYADALRVCDAYVTVASEHPPSAAKVERFRHHAEALRKRHVAP